MVLGRKMNLLTIGDSSREQSGEGGMHGKMPGKPFA